MSANERGRASINYYTYVLPPISMVYKRWIKYSSRS